MLYQYILAVIIGQVCAVTQVTIHPPVVFAGDSVTITCFANETFGALNLKSGRNRPAIFATLIHDTSEFKVKDIVADRVPESGRSVSRSPSQSQFTLNYTSTKCEVDGRTYLCHRQILGARQDTPPSSPMSLTVIDIERFTIDTLQLVESDRCLAQIDQTKCDQCNTNDPSVPVRDKGKELEFVCVANLLFPSKQPNTFKWYINDVNGEWIQVSDDFSPPRITPTTTTQTFCYNSPESTSMKQTYTPDDNAPRLLKVKCEVVFAFEGLDDVRREQVMDVCVLGGKELRTTTRAGTKTTADSKSPTTPKQNGDSDSGFSFSSGPGIAVLTAIIVLVVAGIAGGGYWWWRRHRAPPTDTPAEYYYGDENYS